VADGFGLACRSIQQNRGNAVKSAIGSGVIGGLLFALACHAWAGEKPYDQAQFEQDVAGGKPTVVYLHATWCPTCKVQQPIVDRLLSDPEFKSVTLFEADYDKEVALKKKLRITQQSTFVVFKGGHEVARSTGQTAEPAIRDTFEKAL
jgi:thiol-disulfide isomerase/thioredoxin